MTQTAFDPSRTGEIPLTRPDGARAKRARGVRWFWVVVGWLSLLTVITTLLLRWQGPLHPLGIALVGLTPLFVAPLTFGVLSAWLSRSDVLRVVTAATTAAFVLTVTPADAVIGCRAASAPDQLTIYSANVLANGGRPADVAASVLAADADVVIMQEVRWDFMQELRANPALADYGYWSTDLPGIPTGDLIWSRWPLLDLQVRPFSTDQLVSATVAGPTGEFRINNVHVRAPAQSDKVWVWQQQHQMLSEIGQGSPAIMAGDFNATTDHQPFRNLLSAGWTDVHDVKGCGFDATWPVGKGLPFPVYRLDHVLVTDHFEVLDVRFGDPAGSDHRPMITTVRLR